MKGGAWQPPELGTDAASWPVRTTAAACFVASAAALLERRPDDAKVSPGVWDLPGGHLEPGESPEQALLREVREELGVVCERFRLVLVQDERSSQVPVLYRHYTYLIVRWRGELASREARLLRWFPLRILAGGSDPEWPDAERARLNPVAEFALRHVHAHGWSNP